MKADQLRKGMIFERVVRRLKKDPLPDGASVIPEQLFEVVDHEQRELNGYVVNQVLMGNLVDKSGLMIDVAQLLNPTAWRHHENAVLLEEKRIVEISSRRVEFMNHEAISLEEFEREVEPEEVGVSTEKKISRALQAVEARNVDQGPRSKSNVVVIKQEVVQPEPEEETELAPELQVVDKKDYSKYASFTIDNLDLLVNTFMTMKIAQKQKPRGNDLYVLAVGQDWTGFSEMQYTVREVRDKAVRANAGSGTGKLTYQRVIGRLMEGLVWYGTGQHKQALTDFLQRHLLRKEEKRDEEEG